MQTRFWFTLGLLLTAGALVASARPAPKAALEVDALRTNHKTTPMGIDGQTPCLAWTLTASARGARQRAYRIQVAGLQAAAPGYEELRVAPHPGDTLTHARAVLETNYGRAESSWTRRDGQFRLVVTVPPNTQATVRLPGAARTPVTESGTPLEAAEGLSALRTDGEDRVLNAGSGTYTFEYAVDRPAVSSGEAPGPDATVGALLAHSETRRVLRDAMPEVVASPWLSQAMGFSLERLPRIVPFEVSGETLQSVRRQVRQIRR